MEDDKTIPVNSEVAKWNAEDITEFSITHETLLITSSAFFFAISKFTGIVLSSSIF